MTWTHIHTESLYWICFHVYKKSAKQTAWAYMLFQFHLVQQTRSIYDISKNLYINSMQILIKKIQAESLKLCFLRIKSNLNNRQ